MSRDSDALNSKFALFLKKILREISVLFVFLSFRKANKTQISYKTR